MQARLSNGAIDFTFYRREANRRRRIAKRMLARRVVAMIRNGLAHTLRGRASQPVAHGRQRLAMAARG